MSVREMAAAVLELTTEDEVELAVAGEAETAAFEAFASAYRDDILDNPCKGCH
jgi:hypothetical protein